MTVLSRNNTTVYRHACMTDLEYKNNDSQNNIDYWRTWNPLRNARRTHCIQPQHFRSFGQTKLSSPKRSPEHIGKLSGVNTFLNLFNHWLLNCVISPLPLENLFPLNYQNKTTNVLIKYCKVFFIGLLLLFCQMQPLFLAWIDLSPHQKPWVPSQERIVEFRLGFPTLYLEASISPSTQCPIQFLSILN